MSKIEKSYLQSRVYEELGLNPDDNYVEVYLQGIHGDDRLVKTPIFSSDDHDNIRILVYTLERRLIEFDHPKANPTVDSIYNNKTQTFYLTRLKNPKENQKYVIPKGVGTYPFFPPNLLEKYEKKETIETLVLTEGYFKAFKGAMHGMDVVGLSSITHFADKKTKLLHPDIAKLILTCKVKNVVMLYDGDCLNISLKALEKKEDIAKRPNSFLSSMLKFHELLTPYDCKIFFSHISDYNLDF